MRGSTGQGRKSQGSKSGRVSKRFLDRRTSTDHIWLPRRPATGRTAMGRSRDRLRSLTFKWVASYEPQCLKSSKLGMVDWPTRLLCELQFPPSICARMPCGGRAWERNPVPSGLFEGFVDVWSHRDPLLKGDRPGISKETRLVRRTTLRESSLLDEPVSVFVNSPLSLGLRCAPVRRGCLGAVRMRAVYKGPSSAVRARNLPMPDLVPLCSTRGLQPNRTNGTRRAFR
jgi:hypothetical protein